MACITRSTPARAYAHPAYVETARPVAGAPAPTTQPACLASIATQAPPFAGARAMSAIGLALPSAIAALNLAAGLACLTPLCPAFLVGIKGHVARPFSCGNGLDAILPILGEVFFQGLVHRPFRAGPVRMNPWRGEGLGFAEGGGHLGHELFAHLDVMDIHREGIRGGTYIGTQVVQGLGQGGRGLGHWDLARKAGPHPTRCGQTRTRAWGPRAMWERFV